MPEFNIISSTAALSFTLPEVKALWITPSHTRRKSIYRRYFPSGGPPVRTLINEFGLRSCCFYISISKVMNETSFVGMKAREWKHRWLRHHVSFIDQSSLISSLSRREGKCISGKHSLHAWREMNEINFAPQGIFRDHAHDAKLQSHFFTFSSKFRNLTNWILTNFCHVFG